MNRRIFVSKIALIAGTVAAAPLQISSHATPSSGVSKPGFRLAHITDTHVFAKDRCPENMMRFLVALAAVKPAPDLILHTGDVIMDAMALPDSAPVQDQWDLWRKLAADLPAPVRYCLGNHDIWAGESKGDAFSGKRLAMDELKIADPYYRFQQCGWEFLMLDSARPMGNRYEARLDDVQREWLAAEIESIPATTPLVICSHIPILSAGINEFSSVQENVPDRSTQGRPIFIWTAGASLLHNDTKQVRALLRRRSGVTLCLSGHLHLQDHVVYDGIDYLGNGAVCASWWAKPAFHQTKSGFAILDLHPDGRWNRTYYTYEWLT